MRYQGRVSQWNDDRGYGFVEPNGGGERAFVHVKAFQSKANRPKDGDLIIYQLAKDENNRSQAINIRFAKPPKPSRQPMGASKKLWLTGLAFGFIGGMSLLGVLGLLAIELTFFYVAVSIFTFIIYALDKSAARNQRQRTPESTLHLLSLIGGWPGALIAQQYLRHKSIKQTFLWVFRFTVIVNVIALIWLQSQHGQAFLQPILGSWHNLVGKL